MMEAEVSMLVLSTGDVLSFPFKIVLLFNGLHWIYCLVLYDISIKLANERTYVLTYQLSSPESCTPSAAGTSSYSNFERRYHLPTLCRQARIFEPHKIMRETKYVIMKECNFMYFFHSFSLYTKFRFKNLFKIAASQLFSSMTSVIVTVEVVSDGITVTIGR